jgi:hypothetical protein
VLEQAVMRMAYTYGLYNPAKIPDAPGVPQPDFLNRLWWAQNEYQADQLDDGMANLSTYLQGVNQPAKAMQFVSNLLLAAKQVASIQEDLQDPLFFQELLKFGFEYAKLNPDTSLSAEPQGFLDTLWRAEAGTLEFARAIRTSANGLSNLFGKLDNKSKRQQVLQFGQRMMQAAKQVQEPEMQQKSHDPEYVNALAGLSGAYAQLELVADSTNQDEGLFLETLWKAQSEQAISEGANELESFWLNLETPSTQVFQYSQKLLLRTKEVDFIDASLKRNVSFANEIVRSGKNYKLYSETTLAAAVPLSSHPKARCFESWKDVEVFLTEGRLAHASGNSTAKLEFCAKLVQHLIDCHNDLNIRYGEMLNDLQPGKGRRLYINRRYGPKDTWESHQKRYDTIRDFMEQLFDFLDQHCRDYMRNLSVDKIYAIEAARDAIDRPPPSSPLPPPSEGFRLPDWAVALGIVVIGGAIIIGAAVTLPVWALGALALIAAAAGLKLIDQRSI